MNGWRSVLGVARYERIMLMRTTRYRLLGLAGIAVPLFISVVFAIIESTGEESNTAFGISAFVPFYVYSFLQTFVVAFIAGDFRAADERAHVHEVIAVRPLSTTQIVLGKYLGVLQAMLALSTLVACVAMATQAAKLSFMGTSFRITPYLGYFLLMNVPGLIFMTALTFWLGAMLRNRTAAALTALAYVMGTIFYVAARGPDLFDFGAFYAPLFYSDMYGFGDLSRIAMLRVFYTLLAVFLICASVERYPRLPQPGPWRIGGRLVGVAALVTAVFVVTGVQQRDAEAVDQRAQYLRAHVTRAEIPPPEVVHYELDVRLLGDAALEIDATLRVRNPNDEPLDELVFTLNPGLELRGPSAASERIARDGSVLTVAMSPPLAPGAEATLELSYAGDIDRNGFDLLRTAPRKEKIDGPLHLPEITAWVRPHTVYLPARSGWYPAPGVDYGHAAPPLPSFSTASIRVDAPAGLEVVSQGSPRVVAAAAGGRRTIEFSVDHRVPLLSLNAGRYEVLETSVDDVELAIYLDPEHAAPVDFFTDAAEPITAAIRQLLGAMQRETGLAYPYPRLNVVEIPLVVQWYYEGWRESGGLTQPGVLLLEEDVLMGEEFERQLRRRQRWSRGEIDVPNVKRDILVSSIFRIFLSPDSTRSGLFRSPLVQLWSYDRAFVGEEADLLARGMPVYLQQDVGSGVRALMTQSGRGRFGGGDFRMRGRSGGEMVLEQAAASQRAQSATRTAADWNDVLEAMQQRSLTEMDPDADPELYRSVVDTKGVSVFRMMKAVVGADAFVSAIETFADRSRHAGIDFDAFRSAVAPAESASPPRAAPARTGTPPRLAQMTEEQREQFRQRRAQAGGQRGGGPGARELTEEQRARLEARLGSMTEEQRARFEAMRGGRQDGGDGEAGQPPFGRRQPGAPAPAPAAPDAGPHDPDLDRLVQEWLYSTGVPGYTITRATVRKLENDRGEVVHQVVVRVRNAEPGLGFVLVKAGGFRDEVEQGVQIEGGTEVEVALVIADRPSRVTVEPFFAKNRRPLIAPLRVPDLVDEGSPETYVSLVTEDDLGVIELIVDNEDEGFSMPVRRVQRYLRPGTVGDNWWVNNSAFAYGRYETNYRFKRAGDGAQPAIWETTIPRTGEYDVAFYFLPTTANGRTVGIWGLASELTLTLIRQGGTETLRLNTDQLRGGWNVLGRYRYAAGELASIELSDRADGNLYADAVRWRFVDPGNPSRVYEEDVAPWDLQMMRPGAPGQRGGGRPGNR